MASPGAKSRVADRPRKPLIDVTVVIVRARMMPTKQETETGTERSPRAEMKERARVERRNRSERETSVDCVWELRTRLR